jgi:hypothetical protein
MYSHNFEGRTYEFGANWVQGLEKKGIFNPIWRLAKRSKLVGIKDDQLYEVKDPSSKNQKSVKKVFEKVQDRFDTAYS